MTARRVRSGGTQMPINPDDVPDDGTPVTFETTMRKRVGENDDDDDDYLSPDDFDDAVWMVEKDGERGFEFVGEMDGRPYQVDLRDRHGPGTYQITPMGLDGKPVKKLQQLMKVATPTPEKVNGEADMSMLGSDMPPMMAYMLAQQKEQAERAERVAEQREEKRQRRETAEALRRETSDERRERKEWERQERDERLDRERSEREDKRADERTQMMNALLTGGMSIATALITANANKQPNDANDRMLEALLVMQDKRASGGGTRETMEMLVLLDKLAESRAAAVQPPAPEKEPDIMQSMMQMLPMMAMMKSGQMPPGTQVQQPGQLGAPQPADPIAQIAEAVQNPDVLSSVISRDPQAVACALKEAMNRDPSLQDALVDAMQED